MSYDHSAYVAYGVRVPVDPYERDDEYRAASDLVDEALSVPTVEAACPDVRHLSAGRYDQHSFYLVTKCEEAGYEATWVEDLAKSTENQELVWDRQIMRLLEVMGWGGLSDSFTIGWFVVASTD